MTDEGDGSRCTRSRSRSGDGQASTKSSLEAPVHAALGGDLFQTATLSGPEPRHDQVVEVMQYPRAVGNIAMPESPETRVGFRRVDGLDSLDDDDALARIAGARCATQLLRCDHRQVF